MHLGIHDNSLNNWRQFQHNTQEFNTTTGEMCYGIDHARKLELYIDINPRTRSYFIDFSHYIHIAQTEKRFIDVPIYLWIENNNVESIKFD